MPPSSGFEGASRHATSGPHDIPGAKALPGPGLGAGIAPQEGLRCVSTSGSLIPLPQRMCMDGLDNFPLASCCKAGCDTGVAHVLVRFTCAAAHYTAPGL